MEQVKIAGVHYELVEQEGLISDHGLYGQINYTLQKIQVDAGLKADRKNQAIIHEILHGIFFEAGYEDQDDEMEELVNKASKVLTQVLLENDLQSVLRKNVFEENDNG